MDFDKALNDISDRLANVREFVEGEDIKDILGTEAVNHYRDSFKNEGFTDETVEKWADVKRRDPDSKWYGHSGQTGKFSQARTMAKILSGETGELEGSTSYTKTASGVKVINDAPYAPVHQYGLNASIYGKKIFKMTARPFIGQSVLLKYNIEDKVKREIIKLLKA